MHSTRSSSLSFKDGLTRPLRKFEGRRSAFRLREYSSGPVAIMGPFKLSRIALFGFSALASAWPYCASADDEIARGKYIVENVAKCTECHSPRGQNGGVEKGLPLSGAKLAFKPITPNASWAESAPNIRGIGGYNEESAVTLFSSVIAKNYGRLASPMPTYNMTEEDAR